MENETSIVRQTNNAPAQFNFFDNDQFATMQRVCQMYANSELVPDIYKMTTKESAPKAIANCMIAVEMATRIGTSALMVMQNMVVIQGKPTWSAKFLIATVNTCGRFSQLRYKFKNLGDIGKIKITEFVWNAAAKKKLPQTVDFDGTGIENWECIAYATELGENNEVLESSPVTVKMAILEGWYTKNNSKWPTMTNKMLKYRAASFWTNEFAPEISMGMHTDDEVRDYLEFEDVTDKKVKTTIASKANTTAVTFDNEKEPEPKMTAQTGAAANTGTSAPGAADNTSTTQEEPKSEENPI